MNTNEVVLTKEEYDELIADRDFLDALRGAGVDSWEGYDYALELLEETSK